MILIARCNFQADPRWVGFVFCPLSRNVEAIRSRPTMKSLPSSSSVRPTRPLLISDEIYDEFTYPDARENGRCPSPARFS